uniref:Uncharacterized protein n=1 Tax=Anguilla anguilla TaxID=7936 RepID=A0A0E9WGE2_ANGAN
MNKSVKIIKSQPWIRHTPKNIVARELCIWTSCTQKVDLEQARTRGINRDQHKVEMWFRDKVIVWHIQQMFIRSRASSLSVQVLLVEVAQCAAARPLSLEGGVRRNFIFLSWKTYRIGHHFLKSPTTHLQATRHTHYTNCPFNS